MKPRAAAVIVAGGSGRRLGTLIPKAFVRLNGRPLVEYSLQTFQDCPQVGCIILVSPRGFSFNVLRYFGRFPKLAAIVAGGRERKDSVRAGLGAVPPGIGIVLIHDAARPLVSVDQISSVISAAGRHGAAILAVPVTDTVKRVQCRWVAGTIDRSLLWKAQTPQGFRKEILDRAHLSGRPAPFTDDSQLAEASGIKVRIVPGDDRNLKITVPIDLEIASCLLKKRT